MRRILARPAAGGCRLRHPSSFWGDLRSPRVPIRTFPPATARTCAGPPARAPTWSRCCRSRAMSGPARPPPPTLADLEKEGTRNSDSRCRRSAPARPPMGPPTSRRCRHRRRPRLAATSTTTGPPKPDAAARRAGLQTNRARPPHRRYHQVSDQHDAGGGQPIGCRTARAPAPSSPNGTVETCRRRSDPAHRRGASHVAWPTSNTEAWLTANAPLSILYFAWLRERVGTAEEHCPTRRGRDRRGADRLAAPAARATPPPSGRRTVRCAVNQDFADPATPNLPGRQGRLLPAGDRRMTMATVRVQEADSTSAPNLRR